MVSLDLQVAYLLVPVHKNSQKFLRFKFQGVLYQFICLPFGLCTSPYVFTKLHRPVLKSLRVRGYMSVIYLDDTLCITNSFDSCLDNARATVDVFERLGFIVSKTKSELVPRRVCKYLGFLMINTFLKKKSCRILDLARVLGKLVAACPAIEYGWLYTKVIEAEKVKALEISRGNYSGKLNISDKIRIDLNWWVINIPVGSRVFKNLPFVKEMYTDASDSGWGATDGASNTFGFWNELERKWHINFKELMAVKLALVSLCDEMKDCSILLRIDNTTAITYINKMGGVRLEKFNSLARSIWQWAEERRIILRASYIPSRKNREADSLSRAFNEDSEWELSHEAFSSIIRTFGAPDVDLFASAFNNKCRNYISWMPDPDAC